MFSQVETVCACSRQVRPDSSLYRRPTDWAGGQRRGAVDAGTKVAAGQEDDADLAVHADLAGPGLLQSGVLVLQRGGAGQRLAAGQG